MTTDNPPVTPPADPPKTAGRAAKPSGPKVGDVIQISAGRYALVVGTEKVTHVHEDSNGNKTDRVNREHPLVVDLPVARRHELDPYTED